MNFEENRLRTFSSWPGNAPISKDCLAKAGFFAINQGLAIKCFACQTEISELSYGDQITARHNRQSPTCPMFTNTTSDNVPIPINVPSASSTFNMYSSEDARLASFHNWPIPNVVSPSSLARAGFFYTELNDHTKCAFCKGEVRSWEPGDDPDREHHRYFPNCPFVQNKIVPRMSGSRETPERDNNSLPNPNETSSNRNLVNIKNLAELGLQPHKGPKNVNYATLESRLQSFDSWSANLIQTPDVLSLAGFYYEGMNDQVRCFHCDGGLKHWDPQDDPWTEHARWFPNCSFIQLVKGQDFITACISDHNGSSHLEEVKTKKRARTTSQRRVVVRRDVNQHMSNPIVVAALGIGIRVDLVTRAIRHHLETTGRMFTHADALVEAALGFESEDDVINLGENLIIAPVASESGGQSSTYASTSASTWASTSASTWPSTSAISAMSTSTSMPARMSASTSAGTSASSSAITSVSTASTSSRMSANTQAPTRRDELDDIELESSVIGRFTRRCLSLKKTDKEKQEIAERLGITIGASTELKEENRVLKEARLCKICMDSEMGIVFLPCGHLATCVVCAPNLEACPVCRTAIKATVRTFLS